MVFAIWSCLAMEDMGPAELQNVRLASSTLQYRIWTTDRRVRHGLQDNMSPFFLCLQNQDTLTIFLIQCAYAKYVWWATLDRMHDWWIHVRGICPKVVRT